MLDLFFCYACGGTYNVVTGDTVGLAPSAHDVGIVVGKDGNLVDTLLAELGELLDVLGDVVGGADGSEGTCGGGQWESLADGRRADAGSIGGKSIGHLGKIFCKERSRTGQSEEDDLLVGELLGGVVVDGDTAGGDLARLLGPGDVAGMVS